MSISRGRQSEPRPNAVPECTSVNARHADAEMLRTEKSERQFSKTGEPFVFRIGPPELPGHRV